MLSYLWSAKREGPSPLRRGVAPPRLPSKEECGHSPSPPAELRELLRGWSVSAVPPLPLTAYSGRLRRGEARLPGCKDTAGAVQLWDGDALNFHNLAAVLRYTTKVHGIAFCVQWLHSHAL